ncbi:MAG: NifB/NifX family molybdenum-iron cluster-binding protein [Smithellaceae bacterium]
MLVAISAQGDNLDALVEPRFGRCERFLVIDTDTFAFEVVPNPNLNASGGAGIQTAQMLAHQQVQAVLTGHCGPNAFRTLQAAGITMHVDVTGTVRQAVEQYVAGTLTPAAQPDVQSHSGQQGRQA